MLIKVVQYDVGNRIFPKIIHHPKAVPIRFVAEGRDAFNFLIVDQVGRFFEHHRLVDHVRDIRHDDLGFTPVLFNVSVWPASTTRPRPVINADLMPSIP